MTRIKIEDLPVDEELQAHEMKGIFGGIIVIGSLEQKVQKVRDSGLAGHNYDDLSLHSYHDLSGMNYEAFNNRLPPGSI